jgi:hypothetical protein
VPAHLGQRGDEIGAIGEQFDAGGWVHDRNLRCAADPVRGPTIIVAACGRV